MKKFYPNKEAAAYWLIAAYFALISAVAIIAT
jgi:hypothetical protein